MNDLHIFTNPDFGEVRTIEENGAVMFCGSDVAKALGYSNPRDAISRHCRGVVKRDTPTESGMQEMSFIPESDLYRLVFGSKLPTAERFTDWVTEEILPAIRRHGSYSQKPLTPAEQLLAQANVLVEQERRLSALEETAEKTSRAIEMIAAPAASTRDTWQEETGKAIRQMCAEYALNYHSTTGDLYKELEGRAGIDLDARKRNLQKRLRANGATATECKAVSKLSVIARNPQLREIFTGIVQRKAAGLLTNRMTPA